MSGPLEGWRVLDLTQGIAGPYATKLCSDFGADVIKVERPGRGDLARRLGPFPGDNPDAERSGMHLELNSGKRSVTLDLSTATGRTILLQLAARADLVVESFRAGTLERLDLAPERFAEANPASALVRISNYGQTGPQRDWDADDLLLYAACGILQVTGEPDREPVAIGLYAPLFLAGGIAAAHALGALRAAHRDRQQEVVDVSLHETLTGSMDRGGPNLVSFQYTGSLMVERRERVLISALPNGVFPAADGYIQCTTQVNWFDRFCRVIGKPEWITDPRMTANLNNPLEIGGEIEAAFYEWLLVRTKQQAMEEAQAEGWPLSALNTPADVFRDPHFAARDFFQQVPHPLGGTTTLPGLAVRFMDTPGELRRAPLLGEHNLEVLGELGYAAREVAALRTQGVI
jgi:crotonobetainyl-CoA:carnitine CoA-transferase CaiB-like acyl-CoA transferase